MKEIIVVKGAKDLSIVVDILQRLGFENAKSFVKPKFFNIEGISFIDFCLKLDLIDHNIDKLSINDLRFIMNEFQKESNFDNDKKYKVYRDLQYRLYAITKNIDIVNENHTSTDLIKLIKVAATFILLLIVLIAIIIGYF